MTIRSGTDVSTTIIHDSGPRNDGLSKNDTPKQNSCDHHEDTFRVLRCRWGEFRLSVWDPQV